VTLVKRWNRTARTAYHHLCSYHRGGAIFADRLRRRRPVWRAYVQRRRRRRARIPLCGGMAGNPHRGTELDDYRAAALKASFKRRETRQAGIEAVDRSHASG
jgi:hypothetical protein